MNEEQKKRFFDHLDKVHNEPKEIDYVPDWILTQNRDSGRLTWTAAVKLNGRLGGGVSILFATPVEAWESDIYGHISVVSADTLGKQVRIDPIEWKPLKEHRNPLCQNKHSLMTYLDRWHPYEDNRQFDDPDIFFQKKLD